MPSPFVPFPLASCINYRKSLFHCIAAHSSLSFLLHSLSFFFLSIFLIANVIVRNGIETTLCHESFTLLFFLFSFFVFVLRQNVVHFN